MTLKLVLIVAGSLGFVACNSSENSRVSENDASGVYAREHSAEVTHPETGNKLGMRTIRDSIFVQAVDGGYEISNHKWRLNDYDQEGWVNMDHADDRPFSTFTASLDEGSNFFKSKGGQSETISFDNKAGKIFKNRAKDIEYLKVR